MVSIKKYRHKPVYKKFINFKGYLPNLEKITRFKKRKWNKLLFNIKKRSKLKKRNSFYRFYDQNSYTVSRFNNYFSKNYSQKIINKRQLLLIYGSLSKKYLKKFIKKSTKKSNSLTNSINSKVILNSVLEQRLDVILLRSHFAINPRTSRQFISHGHVSVNGEKVKDQSYIVQNGDKITFEKKIHNFIHYNILKSCLWPIPFNNLQISYKNLQIRVVSDTLSTRPENNFLNLPNIISYYKTI